MDQRTIDVGYRGEKYPYYLGHNEREVLTGFFEGRQSSSRLRLHFASGREKGVRLNRDQWAAYLNDCRCTLGTETGAQYLSCSDKLRYEVNAYAAAHPRASYDEINQAVIQPLVRTSSFVSGRAISSRHFDAIGSGTCLVSFAGRFNDILKPHEHYIVMERDFSNADEVLAKMTDTAYVTELANRTRAMVMGSHCLKHRIAGLMAHLGN